MGHFKPFLALAGIAGLVFGTVAFTQEKPAETKAAAKAESGKVGAAKTAAKENAAKEDDKPKGRLPNNFTKLDLTTAQREKIYAIQASYEPKIDDLAQQIKELMAQRETDVEGVLTAAQKTKLEEIRTANKEKAEARKKELDAKKEADKKEPEKKSDAEAKPAGAAEKK